MQDGTVIPKPPLRSDALLPSVTAGVVTSFIAVILCVSLATLIFSGSLEAYLPRGIATVLITATVATIVCGTFTSLVGVIANIQENPAVPMAVAVGVLAQTIQPGPQLIGTVIALIMVTTLLTGATLLLIGYFRLGGLVRYIPYPVIGGFIGGTGFLLAKGAIGTMADYPLSLATLPDLLKSDQLVLWLPGLIFGMVLFIAVRRVNHFLVMPLTLLAGLIVFFIFLLFSGTSIAQATQQGLLLGDMGRSAVWQPLPLQDLIQADWSVILSQTTHILTVVVLAVINLLLNISGLELLLHKDVDLNYELQTAGAANILSGLSGGMVGFHGLSVSTLSHRMGARGRTTALITGSICFVILLIGTAILAYVPKMMLGGLLIFMGLNFLYTWLLHGHRSLGRTDYLVMVLIMIFVASWGFLVGIGAGLFLMIMIFVVNYSRTNIFHHILSGTEISSNVERSPHYRRALEKMGNRIYILELQGYIFFGTANTILEQIRKRLQEPDLRYLILDFRRVIGLDSSTEFSFVKLKYLAESHQFTLIFTHLTEETRLDLARSGLTVSEKVLFSPDLDRGLEWCENHLLEYSQVTRQRIASTLQVQLAENGFQKDFTAQLKPFLERLQLKAGDYLIHQGEESSDLFFIEVGQVSVMLEMADGSRVRIRTLNMGTVVGELSFHLNVKRSASIIADSITVAYRLSREAMQEIKAKNPELAIAFNELLLRLVSERLIATDRELAALNR